MASPSAISSAQSIWQVVEESILGTRNQIVHAVTVDVDHRGRRVVTGQFLCIDWPKVAKHESPRLGGNILEKVGVAAIDQEVQPAVVIPVGQYELPATAPPRPTAAHPQGCRVALPMVARITATVDEFDFDSWLPDEEAETPLAIQSAQIIRAVAILVRIDCLVLVLEHVRLAFFDVEHPLARHQLELTAVQNALVHCEIAVLVNRHQVGQVVAGEINGLKRRKCCAGRPANLIS